MPWSPRWGLDIIFHRNGLDVVVQSQVLGLKWELPKPGGSEMFRGGGIPFGPPLPDEGQNTSDPFIVVGMSVGNDNFRNVWQFWVGYHSRLSESQFEDGDVVVSTLPGVHQDIRVVLSDEVGVRSYRIGEHLCDTAASRCVYAPCRVNLPLF